MFNKKRDFGYKNSIRQIDKSNIVCFNHLPQHFLYFLPLPHGHGSLRPILLCIGISIIFAFCEEVINGCDGNGLRNFFSS